MIPLKKFGSILLLSAVLFLSSVLLFSSSAVVFAEGSISGTLPASPPDPSPTTLSSQNPDKNPTENPDENNSQSNSVNDSSEDKVFASSTSSDTQNRPNDSEARISIALEMDDLLLKTKPNRVLVSLIVKDASGAVSVRRIPLPLDGQTLQLSLKPGTYHIYKEPAFGLQIKTMVLAQKVLNPAVCLKKQTAGKPLIYLPVPSTSSLYQPKAFLITAYPFPTRCQFQSLLLNKAVIA